MKILSHYILVSLRNFKRNRQNTLVTVLGLALSMAASYLIFGYNLYEQSYDGFHDKKDQLYRIQNYVVSKEKGEVTSRRAATFYAVQGLIEKEIPEVVNSTHIYSELGTLIVGDKKYRTEDSYFTTSAFLEMFSFPLLEGNMEDLNRPGTIFISESMAERLFPGESAMSQRIEFLGVITGSDFDLEVSGIFEDFPPNSYFRAEVLLPKQEFINLHTPHISFDPSFTLDELGWRWTNFYTFIELSSNSNASEVEKKVQAFYSQYRKEYDEQGGRIQTPLLEKVSSMHLNPKLEAELTPPSNGRIVYLFYFVGILILVVAWINYMNITTANAMNRAREIGVRKALGAFKKQIVSQIMVEFFMINFISALLALLIILLVTPFYEDFLQKEVFSVMASNPQFWISLLTILILGALLSGIYPALMLASFRPERVLKASIKHSSGGNLLRRSLLVFQFSIVCMLLSMVAIVFFQINFMIKNDKGFSAEQKLIIEMPETPFQEEDYHEKVITYVNELRSQPFIQSVANSNIVPGIYNGWRESSSLEGNSEQESVYITRMQVSSNFMDDYKMELLEGRMFDKSLATDYETKGIVNMQGLKQLGMTEPSEVIGKTVVLFGQEEMEVIGVIKDFHQQGMHNAIPPMIIHMDSLHEGAFMTLSVPGDYEKAVNHSRKLFTELFPESSFSFSFLDESFQKQYEADLRFQKIFLGFSGLSILLAVSGLFSLSTFFANQKKKEVSVRKVLGASPFGITTRLLWEYFKLVLIAGVISVPLAWYVTHRWLDGFAYHIEINPLIYILPILMICLLVFFTVANRTLQLANTNPTENLRGE